MLQQLIADPKAVLAALAIIVSVSTFCVSFWFSWKSSIAAKRPVLVFVYEPETGWVIRNIGAAPALNVVVAQKVVGGGWFNPVRIPPLAKEKEFIPLWLHHVNTTGLGAIYADIDSHEYTSTCGNDLSKTTSGNNIGKWTEDKIGRHWNHPKYEEKAS